MSFVVEIRTGGHTEVVRDAATALNRLKARYPFEDDSTLPLAHLLRRQMEHAGIGRCSLVYHALDAAADKATSFMTLHLSGGPDPWFRYTEAVLAHRDGTDAPVAAERLREQSENDIAAMLQEGGDVIRRLRVSAAELGLLKHAPFEQLAPHFEGAAESLPSMLEDIFIHKASARQSKFASLLAHRNLRS